MICFTFKATRFTRALEFRIDNYGVYFLAFEDEDYPKGSGENHGPTLKAGISYQYPLWLMNYLCGRDIRQDDFPASTNHLSFYVLD